MARREESVFSLPSLVAAHRAEAQILLDRLRLPRACLRLHLVPGPDPPILACRWGSGAVGDGGGWFVPEVRGEKPGVTLGAGEGLGGTGLSVLEREGDPLVLGRCPVEACGDSDSSW
ncbi:hypothetical protein CRUP_014938, partial [Coryphaenoides rupestris]